jgi:putative colanic acid biosynthesis UDP-glucose lipid carrier transferase
MQGFNLFLKTLEDFVLGILFSVLISPVFLVLAIGVKLSSRGPVFFKQERHGWDGKPILIYKFRSMRVHRENDGELTQATEDDPRITKFGAFLRRTSLDELPQFLNVLEGKMSIVGPRPHAIVHGEYYKDVVDGYMKRHKVKPGITGWAQIHGLRGETDTVDKMQRRIQYDIEYIENWSLWLDFKIILLTFIRGLAHRNAR